MEVYPKIIVVMPAFNASKTLFFTYEGIPKDIVHEIILVDDASTDGTPSLAERLKIKVIRHPHNVWAMAVIRRPVIWRRYVMVEI